MNIFFYLLAFIAGSALTLQIGLNSSLRTALANPLLAALVSFLVGFVALLAYALVVRTPLVPHVAQPEANPWYNWLGGALGGFYVTSMIYTAPRLGGATTVGLVIAGQLLLALVADHYGWLGFQLHQLSLLRILGALLLIIGVYLIQKF